MSRVNIVLTGFMATGKTTVGRLVAERLAMEFVDTDRLIEERHGPVPEIFETGGEARFRLLESQIAAELADRNGLVIATGGRMLLDPLNRSLLGRSGRIFCLVADPVEIERRLDSDPDAPVRPLIDGPDRELRIRKLIEEREPMYADFEQVTTDGKDPDRIAGEIAARIEAG